MTPRKTMEQRAAKTVGLLLLLAPVTIIAVSYGIVFPPVSGLEAPQAARNIVTHEALYRVGLVGNLFYAVELVVLSAAIYVMLQPVDQLLALLAALFTGRLTKSVLEETTRNTLGVSAMFLWIILGALCFSSVYDGLGAVKAVKTLLIDTWEFGPWTVLILMLLSFIVMGMFLDDTAMLVIVAPLYIPLVKSLGFNPIWFGVLYTITCQIAYITPPFGYNLFLMRALAPPQITLIDIYRSIVPFFFLMVLSLAIIMIFPQIALWLPEFYKSM